MKTPPTFQIKVAIIGNVSAGKTTVLNALFRDKFGEVSMKRTTAGVNEFAISSREEWALVSDSPRDSKSILKEIVDDNVELRASDQVQMKRFEIELEEPLCEMRKDTQLVIVDIPGVNEADMSKKYKEYVENHWNTFDCVVVVMDGRQGVNTEEQVSLLRFVKTNLEEKKDLPVVILCNKIDDPDDKEQSELMLEAQHEVEKIFNVSDRQASLQQLLDTNIHDINTTKSFSPVFIPVSGITAFIFQICSNMTLEKFQEFDKDMIAKLGRERIGKRRWKRLSEDDQVQEAYKAVSDPEGYQEGIEDSNFHKFLKTLSLLVGGEATQEEHIKKQIQVSLENIHVVRGW